MTGLLNCATGTIAPYVPNTDNPWNRERASHLYRRLGFGATPQQLEDALAMNPLDIVDAMIDQAKNAPPIPEPEWAYWTYDDYEPDDFIERQYNNLEEWQGLWVQDMIDNPLRAKLNLFWHNHFVTIFQAYDCSSSMYQYYKALDENKLGDFKTFVSEIGKTPAMLVFLNGVDNTKQSPNENYARELYELFTLGADNGYTQEDIIDTSRALTGYTLRTQYCGTIEYDFTQWDRNDKTIFGKTGKWGYDDVMDLLFDERGDKIATYICTKLYKEFITFEVDEDIVAQMATTFKNNNFNIEPVLRQLLKSEHFFDLAVESVKIKSPFESIMTFVTETQFVFTADNLPYVPYFAAVLGQELFSPIDVAGWVGNRSWIDTNSLSLRWKVMQYFIFTLYTEEPEKLRELAIALSAGSNDAALVTKSIVDFFMPLGLQRQVDYDRATLTFKADIPSNYFDDGTWNLYWDEVPGQVGLLLDYLARIPEFQMQ